MIALAVVYRLAPDRDAPRFAWVSTGSLVATVLWIVGSVLFSLYVNNFGNYNKTYGTIAGVVVLMLWLYLTSYIVLLGAGDQRRVGAPDPPRHHGGRPSADGRTWRHRGRRARATVRPRVSPCSVGRAASCRCRPAALRETRTPSPRPPHAAPRSRSRRARRSPSTSKTAVSTGSRVIRNAPAGSRLALGRHPARPCAPGRPRWRRPSSPRRPDGPCSRSCRRRPRFPSAAPARRAPLARPARPTARPAPSAPSGRRPSLGVLQRPVGGAMGALASP